LEARIQAIHRRNSSQKSTVIESGGISLDKVAHTVKVEGRSISLTTAEYRILELLMDNPDKLLTHEVIMQHIWHDNIDNEGNTLDVHLSRLRRKLGFTRGKCPIENIYGQGYRFSP
jgi:two-component system response regulator PhoP